MPAKEIKCKECKGLGSIPADVHLVGREIDIPCWVCGGTALKGMTSEQATWYLKRYKAFDTMKAKIFRCKKIEDPTAYNTLRNEINIASTRLGIRIEPLSIPKVGVADNPTFLHLRAELEDLQTRLRAIPGKVAAC